MSAKGMRTRSAGNKLWIFCSSSKMWAIAGGQCAQMACRCHGRGEMWLAMEERRNEPEQSAFFSLRVI